MQYSFLVEQELDNWTVKDFLRKKGVSAAAIRAVKLLPNGITVNGIKKHTNERLKAGETVYVISAADKETLVMPEDIALEIVYESKNAMVINKPAGMPVHPTRGHLSGTLANAFCGLMEKRGTPMPFRAVNRIDKNTSGLVLLALNSFSVPFLSKTVEKKYYAVIEGRLAKKEGVIDLPIARSDSSIITRCVSESGKRAVTEYKVIGESDVSLIRAVLVTGRTHQIRVHFSHIGHPLCGDDLYMGKTDKINRHALHCGKISFIEPQCENRAVCTAPFPKDIDNLLNGMNFICEI